MASDLKVTTSVSILGRKKDSADLTTPVQPVRINRPFALTNGTGDDQANEIFADTRTLAAASETLDLTSTLANFAGTTIVYTALKGVWIFNRSTTASEDLVISGNFGGVLGGTTPTITLKPGFGILLIGTLTGYTVTNTSADQLKIDAGAATFAYDIVLIGTV